ncbi:hypothetical protein DL93DRAFT_2157486 [Clavulina sp. PMI_390]|nr:hypothetical protein DL93DRAFT_2157486 [Clavulina sp. PMI_390]
MECIIEANPDAGGIGVRTAIYIQSLLPAVALLVELIRGHPITANTNLLASHAQAAKSSVLTSMALIISAIIQHSLYGLSIFHALLVLNLCWIAFIGGWLAVMPRLNGNNTWKASMEKRIDQLELALIAMVYLMAGFGLWVMHNPIKFDTSPDSCTNSTIFWVLGTHVKVTSAPFRVVLLVIYSLLFVPIPEFSLPLATMVFALVYVPVKYLMVIIAGVMRWYGTPSSITDRFPDSNEDSKDVMIAFTITFLGVMFIVTTEMTIRANTVGSDENTWSLGQTLAVFVALLPMASIIHQMVTKDDPTRDDKESPAKFAPPPSEKQSMGTQTDLEAQLS